MKKRNLTKLNIALSPCPNDTFLFYAWLHNKVSSTLQAQPTYADVEQLNIWAREGTFALTKLSFAAYLEVRQHYLFLPVGAALGFGVGPKLIAKKPIALKKLKKIAFPGPLTTAHLLFDRLLGVSVEKHFCRYDQICDLVISGKVDAGLVIHETRFTFPQKGLVELLDLGAVWESQTNLPLPLGGIAMHRDTTQQQAAVITLQASLRYAQQHTPETLPFLLTHAQEKDVAVVLKHVNTYITEESMNLSTQGIAAIENLLQLPKEEWLYTESLLQV
ncbi:MAG: 1,4-dihydroxy-6-naphthoate synthase [Verrucomicrobia bacterium]|nr:1,4-dihydroxy-6-naphthoate synthase [Verrucomicrobiota bacterium]MBS0646074.1 1,4-dihydroxy-6-naphthoate synthase [Verrucomicrobiota bacterium]